jgi:hypothetical protein
MGLAAFTGERLMYPTQVASLRLTAVGNISLDNGVLEYAKPNPQAWQVKVLQKTRQYC